MSSNAVMQRLNNHSQTKDTQMRQQGCDLGNVCSVCKVAALSVWSVSL